MILILEDDPDRTQRFRAVLSEMNFHHTVRIWKNAYQFIQETPPLLPVAKLISLDHDLIPENPKEDWGDGYMVVKYLTSQPEVRPVILHSSNAERVRWMAGELELENWPFDEVAPIGDDWIETEWKAAVKKLLG